MHLHSLMTVHVRWPAKNSGAFVFGCPFLCFFLLGKQKKEIVSILYRIIFKLPYFLCLEAKKVQRKFKDIRRGGPPICPANAHEDPAALKFIIVLK